MRPSSETFEVLVAQAVGASSSRTIVRASLLGVSADLAIELDAGECLRRSRAGAGRLDDLDVLTFLMGLPRHEPVCFDALSPAEHKMLQRVPRGSVEVRDDYVVRVAGVPTRSVLALVYDEDWLRGLRSVSVFAPVATRMLIMSALPSDAAMLLATAAEYGIGVGTSCSTGAAIHLQPAMWRQRYFTPGGWLFREQVFQLTVQDGDTNVPRHHT